MGREYLEEHGGSLLPQWHILFTDHEEIHVVDDSRLMNSKGKSRVRNHIKARIRAGAVAVMALADVYMSRDATGEVYATGLTLSQAVERGLCTATEHVIVSVESPVFRWVAAREYQCHGKQIEWVGETTVIPGDRIMGPDLAGFFPSPAAGDLGKPN